MLRKIFSAKYLSKEQQIKRSFIKGLLVSVVLIAGVVVVYQVVIIPQAKRNEKIRVMNNIEKEKGKEIIGYQLIKDIKQGDPIDVEKDVKKISLPKELMPDNCISDKNKLKGKVARMALSPKTTITNSMLLENEDILTQDLRKQDYSHILLNKNLQKGNCVDIRLKKKDGTDYIVAAKKQVLDLNGTTMVTKINDTERSYINNATVEASVTGATLYTTIYVDPENQAPAEVTYVINDNIKNMIKNNPNIIKNAEQDLQNKNTPQNAQQSNSSSDSKPQFVEGGHQQ